MYKSDDEQGQGSRYPKYLRGDHLAMPVYVKSDKRRLTDLTISFGTRCSCFAAARGRFTPGSCQTVTHWFLHAWLNVASTWPLPLRTAGWQKTPDAINDLDVISVPPAGFHFPPKRKSGVWSILVIQRLDSSRSIWYVDCVLSLKSLSKAAIRTWYKI